PMRSLPAPDVGLVFGGTVTTTAALTEDVLVMIQGVNKLHKKFRIPAGTAAGASFVVGTTSAIQATTGEPVFFTIYSPTVIGGNVTWSPAMNAVPVAAANINKAILDPTFDNSRGPSRDPMSGGYRRW